MSLVEFYYQTTNMELPMMMQSTKTDSGSYRQFKAVGQDLTETVRDSIHLDWRLLNRKCPECGVTVKLWDSFAYQLIYNQTWNNSVAFQPLSARYETERWDSPIEGFVFRLWTWPNPGNTFTFGRNLDEEEEELPVTTTERPKPKKQPKEEEEEDDIFALYRKSRHDDDGWQEDDANSRQSSSAMDILGSMLPFGHANLGARRLMAIDSSSHHHQNVHKSHTKRTKKHHSRGSSSFRYLDVTESIFYATLNHTSPHLVRLFTHPIVQRCTLNKNQQYSCLPHYNTQSNSSKFCQLCTALVL